MYIIYNLSYHQFSSKRTNTRVRTKSWNYGRSDCKSFYFLCLLASLQILRENRSESFFWWTNSTPDPQRSEQIQILWKSEYFSMSCIKSVNNAMFMKSHYFCDHSIWSTIEGTLWWDFYSITFSSANHFYWRLNPKP